MLQQLKNYKIFDAILSYLRVQVNYNLSLNNLNISIFKESFKKIFCKLKIIGQVIKIDPIKFYFSYEKKEKKIDTFFYEI